jgi:hypothetical protein
MSKYKKGTSKHDKFSNTSKDRRGRSSKKDKFKSKEERDWAY